MLQLKINIKTKIQYVLARGGGNMVSKIRQIIPNQLQIYTHNSMLNTFL